MTVSKKDSTKGSNGALTAETLLDAVVAAHGAGERRPQQEKMVQAINHAIHSDENLIVQAGTGVGKSLGYLIPVVASGKRVVVSTATNQLSEQITELDIPFLQDVYKEASGGKSFSAAILKGRSNYACLLKIDKINQLNASDPNWAGDGNALDDLMGLNDIVEKDEVSDEDFKSASTSAQGRIMAKQSAKVIAFLDENPNVSGDRRVLPVVQDETWQQLSSTPYECIGKAKCPFASKCFSEAARGKAKLAQVVVTNHHLSATDMTDPDDIDNTDDRKGPEWKLLGQRDVVIFDEVHELDGALSSSWGVEMKPKGLRDLASTCRRAIPTSETSAREAITDLNQLADDLEGILALEQEPRRVTEWDSSYNSLFKKIAVAASVILASANNRDDQGSVEVINNIAKLLDTLNFLARDHDVNNVLSIEKSFERVHIQGSPLLSGPELMKRLNYLDTKMVATSATISVNRSFDIPKRNWSVTESKFPTEAMDVGTPFDYPKQGILYIPSERDFPAPVGKDRFEHTAAILEAYTEFVKAAGGRTLALSSTTKGAKAIAAHLRETVDTPVLSQWDGPPGAITQQFAEEENSTLCATMGMWHGLNVPGPSLSVVLIDKIPFPPFNDPLSRARQDAVEADGGNGFTDVYVAQAATMLAQGTGRLVRHTQDRGLVAIFDPRLRSKGYGRGIINSLPDMWLTDSHEIALKSVRRLFE